MNNLRRIFLHRYDNRDYREQQRAFVIIILYFVLAVLMLLNALVIAVVRERGFADMSVLAILAVEFVLLGALLLTIKGHASVAAHFILAPLTLILWGIIFMLTRTKDILIAADTIVYMIPLIIIAMLISGKRSVVIYTFLQIAGLVAYSLVNEKLGFLTHDQAIDFIADCTVSFIMVGVCCVSALAMNERSHRILEGSLEDSRKQGEHITSMLAATGDASSKVAGATDVLVSTTHSFSNNAQTQAATVEEVTASGESV